jgi:hypothetical protein
MTINKPQEGKYNLVSFNEAKYAFLDLVEGVELDGDTSYDYYGTVVKAHLIGSAGNTYVYYQMDQEVVPLTLDINAAISRHFTNQYCGYWNSWCHLESVIPSVEGHSAKPRTAISTEWLTSLPKSSISGDHHIHFDAVDMWKVLQEEFSDRLTVITSLPADSTTSFVAGVMLWLATLDEELYKAVSRSGLFSCNTMSEFGKLGKEISVRAKSLQNLLDRDLKPLFEIDVLVNRIMGEVDWAQEKENRVTPNLASVSTELVYTEAMRLFTREDATKQPATSMTWEKFFKSRWQWSAAGSIHSQYPEDTADVPKSRELKNKFIALSLTEHKEFAYYFQRPPSIVGWGSVKYEWNKLRAIYGTDLTSYIISHFGFYNCEDTLPNEFPVGTKAQPEYVRAKVASVIQNRLPMS